MALLLIASPLMMYGNSNSFILSNAYAIEDGSNTDEIKTMIEQPTMSDGFEKQALSATEEEEDEEADDDNVSAAAEEEEQNNVSATEEGDSPRGEEEGDSAEDGNDKSTEVQTALKDQALQCEEGIQYWAFALKFIADKENIGIPDAYKQFAEYFIASVPEEASSHELKAAVDLMKCLKESAISIVTTQDTQKNEEIPTAQESPVAQQQLQEQEAQQQRAQKLQEQVQQQLAQELQQQKVQQKQAQMVQKSEEIQTAQKDAVTQQEMQQQQYENLGGSLVSQQQQNDQVQNNELLPLPTHPTQDNVASEQESNASEQVVEEPISQVVQQPDLAQDTEENKQQSQSSAGGSDEIKKELSIISQQKMQQQQYENFKELIDSTKEKHHEIQIVK